MKQLGNCKEHFDPLLVVRCAAYRVDQSTHRLSLGALIQSRIRTKRMLKVTLAAAFHQATAVWLDYRRQGVGFRCRADEFGVDSGDHRHHHHRSCQLPSSLLFVCNLFSRWKKELSPKPCQRGQFNSVTVVSVVVCGSCSLGPFWVMKLKFSDGENSLFSGRIAGLPTALALIFTLIIIKF